MTPTYWGLLKQPDKQKLTRIVGSPEMLLRIGPEDIRDPFKSDDTLVGIEDAAGCDGAPCGMALFDFDGAALTVPRHDHLRVAGYNPLSSPRYYPVLRS
jgi:hypothetical protein